ncbi:MAG TPA: hypothetical protein PLJ38_01485, partial [bacterium]|nr:hypothetical protein [bacterium]
MKKNVLKIVLILVITNILFVALAVSAETNAILLFDSKNIADGERLTVPLVSPDGKRIVFSNLKRNKLWLADVDKKNNAKIIADADGCGLNIQWLGNNKILYLKQTADDYKRNTYSLFIYDIELGKSIQLTAATYDKNNPIIVDDLIFSVADLENQSYDKNRMTIEKIDEQIKKLLKGIFPFKKFDDNKIAVEGNNISLQSKALKIDSGAKSKSAELPQFIYYTDNLKLLELNTKTLE